MNKIFSFSAGILVSLAVYGCGVGGNYIPADSLSKSVASFKLVLPSNNVSVGNSLKISTLILQTNGQTAVNPLIEWKVSDDKLAKIDKDGNLTALAEGTVTVTAIYGGKESTATVLISKGTGTTNATNTTTKPGTTIQNNPATLSLIKNIVVKLPSEASPVVDYNINALDTTLKFTAQAFDAENKLLEDVTFSWTSSNPFIASVNSTGTVTALASGTTNIIALAGDKTSNIVRIIVPNGKTNINVSF